MIMLLASTNASAKIEPLDVSGNYFRITSQNIQELEAIAEDREYWKEQYKIKGNDEIIPCFLTGLFVGYVVGYMNGKSR